MSEITNKRRLSSLGPGGLQRNSAKLEVRDVHRSHYGRICPIETPEGPNIGLISQLTSHARVDEFGFIQTPYRKVTDGVVAEEIIYMTAQEETGQLVAPADVEADEAGLIKAERVQVRCAGGDVGGASYPIVRRDQIDFMDVSPVQIISVATALIPFLENDDANRALMGANMQRQAVPCLRSDKPVVGTGYERVAAVDSGAAVIAHRPGVVTYVSALEIRVTTAEGEVDRYELMHMVQSNKSTCFTHRPVVRPQPGRAEGRLPRGRRLLRPGRAGPRQERARRVHAVERLQLRGRDPHLGAHGEGRRVHVDPHRAPRDARPSTRSSDRRRSPATSRTSARRP